MEKLNKKKLFVVREMVKDFFANRVFAAAAELSYYYILLIFPLLIFVDAVLGNLNISSDAARDVLRMIFPQTVVDYLGNYLEGLATRPNTTYIVVGCFVCIFSLVGILTRTRYKLSSFFGVGQQKKYVSKMVFSLVFLFILLVLLVLISFIMLFGGSVIEWIFKFGDRSAADMWNVLKYAVSIAVVMFVLVGIYYFLCDVKVKFRNAFLTSAVVTALWALISTLFSFYVEHVNDYTTIYGSVSALFVLITWIYLTNFLVFTGASCNSTVYRLEKAKEIADVDK